MNCPYLVYRRIFYQIIYIFIFFPLLAWESEHKIHQEYFSDTIPALARQVYPPVYRPSMLSKEIYGFLPYWSYNSGYFPNRWDLLTRIAYFSVEVDSLGNIVNRRGWCPSDLRAESTTHNVFIDLCITLFDLDGSRINYLLSNSSRRNNLISNIASLLSEYGDGVNLDFELPQRGDTLNLVDFFRELRGELGPNKCISLCLPLVDWRDAFLYDSLSNYLDLYFIMGYGYYSRSSAHTGPIAPLDDPLESYDITRTVNDYISDGANPEELILGLPLYGYDWQADGSNRGANTLSPGIAQFMYEAINQASTYGRLWDTNSLTPWYRYGSWNQCWYEDTQALDYKYGLVNSRNLRGVGFWALGYDNNISDFWTTLESAFSHIGNDTLIVDDLDPECIFTGSWATSETGGWIDFYRWTSTTYQPDSAKYFVNLQDGRWSVYIRYRAGSNRAGDTKVTIYTSSSATSVRIDQRVNSLVWYHIGDYEFTSGYSLKVAISDDGCASGAVVIADAVMFILRDPMVISDELSENPKPSNDFVLPNPVMRYLRLPSTHTNMNFSIYDIMGRCVYSGDKTREIIDLNHLPIGTYFIKLGNRVSKKFILLRE